MEQSRDRREYGGMRFHDDGSANAGAFSSSLPKEILSGGSRRIAESIRNSLL